MKKTETILGLLVFIGIGLKLAHINGANILLLFTLLTLSFIYYFFGFAIFNNISLRGIFKRNSYKDTNALKIIGAIACGISLSTTLIAILFKLQFWPGSKMMLIIGLLSLLLILIISIVFYLIKKSVFYVNIFKRIAIYGTLGVILYLTPSDTMIDIIYRNDKEYAELFKKSLKEPLNNEVREELIKRRNN